MLETTTLNELASLYSRAEMCRLLAEEIAACKRYGRPLSLILLEIDNLPAVRDTHGRAAEDEVFRRVTRLLIENTRDTDFTARYGAEQLALIVRDTPDTGAFRLMERLRRLVAAEPFVFGSDPSGTVRVTLSAGIVGRPGAADSADALVRAALEALHEAKRRGSNCTVQYRHIRVKDPAACA